MKRIARETDVGSFVVHLAIGILLTLLMATPAFSAPSIKQSASFRPTWEAGLGIGGQALRDYRGSDEGQVQAYPIPLFFYRGKFLKADREGVRGDFIANDRIEINVSGETALNGSSDDNEARRGMPELDSAFELGPSLNINLSGGDFHSGWQLRLPVRAVVTVGEAGIRHRGFTFNPRFTYSVPNLSEGWRAHVNLGALYGSEEYHDYYYEVAPEFVLPTRPLFDAEAGFSGYYAKASVSKKIRSHWIGVSLRYDNIDDAIFRESPLVLSEHYAALSFIWAWMPWRSSY